MAACFYGCYYSRKRGKRGNRSESGATAPTRKRMVWPAPESPSPLPLPSPGRPYLKKMNSHPLPQPEFEAATSGGNCVKSYDFDTVAGLCHHFRASSHDRHHHHQNQHNHQRKPSIFRCALDEVTADVILFDDSKMQHGVPLTDEAWIVAVNSLALVEQHNYLLSRVMGFSIKGRRRLIIMEAPTQPSSRLDRVLRQLDWDSRLNIALTCAQGLDHLHKKSPLLQAHGFGAWNVLVNDTNTSKVTLQLMLLEDNTERTRGGNVRGFGILLLELLTGKRNMDELLTTESVPGHEDGDSLFVRWATGMINDRIKLGSILDPKLLLHFPSLTAAKKLATFALSCLHSDPLQRPTMQEAVTMLQSLLIHREQSDSNRRPHLLGRSATFSYHQHFTVNSRYSSTPPSRTMKKVSFPELRTSGTRSAGASPARYMMSWSTTTFQL